ncbi:MAG: hypothetical protein ABIV06_03345 [Thermoanaerobaculia bacterium]
MATPGTESGARLCRFAVTVLMVTSPAAAQLRSVDVSNDITWTSGASTIDDEGARRVTLPSAASALDLGVLAAAADVTAYQLLDDGSKLFALDTFVDFGGGVQAGPEDIVRWNGAIYSLYFDGSASGIPAGATIDAVARQRQAGVTSTLLSFDVPVALPGGLTADDEDIVAWNGATWSMFWDGSANGVPTPLDVDGFDRDPVNGTRYFSFDISGKIATVDFDDEDVVAFDGSAWSLAYDASASLSASFAAGDLDALGVRTANIFKDGFEINSTIEWSASVP